MSRRIEESRTERYRRQQREAAAARRQEARDREAAELLDRARGGLDRPSARLRGINSWLQADEANYDYSQLEARVVGSQTGRFSSQQPGVQVIPVPHDAPHGPASEEITNYVRQMAENLESMMLPGRQSHFSQPFNSFRVDGCTIEAHPAAPDDMIYTMPQVIPHHRGPAMGRWGDSPWDRDVERETIERVDVPQEALHLLQHERVETGVRNFIRELRSRMGRNVDFTVVMSPRTMGRLLRELEWKRDWRGTPGMRAAVEAVQTPWKDYVMKKEGLAFEDQMDAALAAFAEGAA